MRALLQYFSKLIRLGFLANPYVRIGGLRPIVWVWGLSFVLIVLCTGSFVHTNTAARKDLKQAQSSIAQYKQQLAQKGSTAVVARTNFVDELPKSVVPEDVIADLVQFSGKHDLKLVDVAIQPDAIVPDKLSQIHYSLTLRGAYPAAKEVLQNVLEKHTGLVVDRLLIRQVSRVGSNAGGISRSTGGATGNAPNLNPNITVNLATSSQEVVVALTQWLRPSRSAPAQVSKGASS